MPNINVKAQGAMAGKAECVMELNSRRVLYSSNADIRLPMASTTKIATAITILDNQGDITKEMIIPKEAEGVEGSSVYLKAGDKYTIEELLYGLMLRSGNDCATALALYHAGSIENFSAKMNEIAQKAGALHTNFKNPHGLPCNGHYTTAKDLSLITCYAMQNSVFAKIVSTRYFEGRNWKNKNKMLTLCEGGIGVKTGYTKEAGRCLVSAVERNGMIVVCSLLHCPTTYERSIELINDAFSAYENVKLINKEDIFELEIHNKKIKCSAKKDVLYPLLQAEREHVEIKTFPCSDNKSKEIVGKYEICLSKRLLFSGNLYIL